ncbi:hypothetical protein CLV24_11158 [Pontibacter ummariensis]|uniref:Uncharacterized protein n=1 Tax=Pontibacter ummariensis TaxID=1610492 RepID=A0A239GGR4_9BACT|nr:hypothetical protein [Pontibacter ummariensis]PRY11263.1 hypothetical protein CLV24_11158 [Pontibacter ummariensis]SNS68397.1 hypothetical protein SAMN06296052_11158 [Pontibacter ummariensis]
MTGKRLHLPALLFAVILFACLSAAFAQESTKKKVKVIPVVAGWANNSVNAVIFRRNALVTHHNTQYMAFYDPGTVPGARQAKARLGEMGSKTQPLERTASDAHNAISMMIDGEGLADSKPEMVRMLEWKPTWQTPQ